MDKPFNFQNNLLNTLLEVSWSVDGETKEVTDFINNLPHKATFDAEFGEARVHLKRLKHYKRLLSGLTFSIEDHMREERLKCYPYNKDAPDPNGKRGPVPSSYPENR